MILRRSQRGDTIVEVLISVAVLSLILSVSYALANRSSQAVRQAQERGEAQKLSESQIESLKAYLSTPGNNIADGYFCLYQDTKADSDPANDTFVTKAFDAGFGLKQRDDPTALSGYPNECRTGTDGRYHSLVNKNGDNYSAVIRWDKVNGDGNDEVSTLYKVYPSAGINALDQTGLPTNENTSGQCPSGFRESSSGCVPIPPSIRVEVQKIPPRTGGVSSQCSDTGVATGAANVWNIPVTLSGIPSQTKNTNSDSFVLFDELAKSQTYNVSYTVPTTTRTTPYGTAKYEACPTPTSTSSTLTTTNEPNNIQTKTFKYRTICTYEMVDHPWLRENIPGSYYFANERNVTYLYYSTPPLNANGNYYWRSFDTADYSIYNWTPTSTPGVWYHTIHRVDSSNSYSASRGWLRIFQMFYGDQVYNTRPVKVSSPVCP